MNTNEQELNRKLAEWAGFRWQPITETWLHPKQGLMLELPNFTESLDVCFKWLVPRIDDEEPQILFVLGQYGYEVSIYLSETSKHYDCIHQNPALALCLAIEKLIDSNKAV